MTLPKVFGYQCGADAHVPNTLPALRSALLTGANALVVDVELTRDGVLVVCDDRLLRATSARFHGTREVKVSPLAAGWTYEGWLVWQGPPQVWISYGKFRPDETGLLTSRDDTGTGPFAGAEDFRNAGVEDVPGEEWTSDEIAAQLGIELPGGFDLPLEVDAVDGEGRALWHHVISIEPAADLVEGPLEGEPFPVRPYENPIGAGGPGLPRTIELVREAPSAEVRRVGS